jgi:hypothetical protein
LQTPVTSQDAAFARRIADDNRRVIVVLTKGNQHFSFVVQTGPDCYSIADLARDSTELASVQDSVRSRLAPVLGYPPRVFAVAACPTMPFAYSPTKEGSIAAADSEGRAKRSARGRGFQFNELIDLVFSMQHPAWLRPNLLRSALLRLDLCSQHALESMQGSESSMKGSQENCRKALLAVDHSCDELMHEVSVCRTRLRHQARELEGFESLVDSDLSLSAPIVAFRRQLEHTMRVCKKELAGLTDGSVSDECCAELESFRTRSVDTLRATEIEMDDSTGPGRQGTHSHMLVSISSPDRTLVDIPSPSSTSKALSYATATAAGLLIGATLGIGTSGSAGLMQLP